MTSSHQCPWCRCLPPDPCEVWDGHVNRDAPFYELVVAVDQYAWDRTHRREAP